MHLKTKKDERKFDFFFEQSTNYLQNYTPLPPLQHRRVSKGRNLQLENLENSRSLQIPHQPPTGQQAAASTKTQTFSNFQNSGRKTRPTNQRTERQENWARDDMANPDWKAQVDENKTQLD